MEEYGGTRFDGINIAVRKKRSQTSRRPRPDAQPYGENRDRSPSSSTPPSDEVNKVSSDENSGFDGNLQKEFSLNQCLSRVSSIAGVDREQNEMGKKEGGRRFNMFFSDGPGRTGFNNKRSSEGVLAPANWKSMRTADIYSESNGDGLTSGPSGVAFDGSVNESKVKKVKLKVCGVTRTIHANSSANDMVGNASSAKSSRPSDVSRILQKQILQGNSDDDLSPSDKRSGLQGIPWKDFSRGGFSFGKENSSIRKMTGKNIAGKQGDQSGAVRKSKRVPKRRMLDGDFGEEDDDEIRYLEKLKISKVAASYREDDEESGKKQRKLSRLSNIEKIDTSGSVKGGKKKSRSDRASEDTDYEEEEELASDSELDGKKKKQKKESVDLLMDNRREMTLTTRQRALQSSKDASSVANSTLIEFPNGLPPAPSRKQKEKLSEVEQQLKKAEAAQRRRMQVEKAARESEAEAIRKILGQDSNRKKREEKNKKRQEELAQEKAANALNLASNTIRLVMGPTGTVMTFSEDIGLPSLFNAKPCSYPPPRESCVGPSCTNPYKYRDSKSKLPLCSLQCYKAVQEQERTKATC